METVVRKVRNIEEITPEEEAAILEAGAVLSEGGLVAFPTETVYGLGGDALNPESSRKIYAAKGRPSDNPLIVHICDMADVDRIAEDPSGKLELLAKHFWPGPLTIILNKKDAVPMETTGGLQTVAVRFPSDLTAQRLIRAAGGYVAAPSANRSGRPSPTSAKYVEEDMNGRIEMILDGGDVGIGLESTIIDLTAGVPEILRPGYITKEMLSEVLGQVDTDKTILSADSGIAPKAPGMKYRHYAPQGELTIVEGESRKVLETINRSCLEAHLQGKKTGVIATNDMCAQYEADVVKCVGDRDDAAAVAHNLFRILREFDDEQVDVMFSESFSFEGMGQAIMNRLLKAAGHHVIHV